MGEDEGPARRRSRSCPLQLRNIPGGTFTGTLVGEFTMAGDLEGKVNLTLTGEVEDEGTGKVRPPAAPG